MNKADHLTKKEWDQFREAFKQEVEETNHAKVPVRNRALIELLFTLILRVSDLLDLKVKDVVGKNGNIRDEVYLTEKKNNNFKGVRIKDKPAKALKDWLEVADLERDDYIFPSPYTEGHLSRQHVDNIIKDKLPEVEFEFDDDKTISSHSGRKSIARKLYEEDVRREVIRKALGHQSFEVTQKYLGVNERDVRKATDEVDW